MRYSNACVLVVSQFMADPCIVISYWRARQRSCSWAGSDDQLEHERSCFSQ